MFTKALIPLYKMKLAEREGFEPSTPFWSVHAFQACAFNHSAISPAYFSRGFNMANKARGSAICFLNPNRLARKVKMHLVSDSI